MEKIALTIGINKYGSGADLAGCVNDAKDWAQIFDERDVDPRLQLLDRDATGANMREAMKEHCGLGQEGDALIVQYSGHGSYTPDDASDEPDGVDECLCPADIFDKGAITDDEIWNIYSKRKPNVRVIFISDSCHSGTVTRFAPTKEKQARKARFLPPSTFLSSAKKQAALRAVGFRWSVPVGRHVGLLLSGCADPEYSYDAWFNDRPNGAFSYNALNALRKLPKKTSYNRWFGEYRKVLPSQDYPQTPALYGSSTMRRWLVF